MPEDACTFGEDFNSFEFCHACNHYDACKSKFESDGIDLAAVLDIVEAVSNEPVPTEDEVDALALASHVANLHANAESVVGSTNIDTVWNRMRTAFRDRINSAALTSIDTECALEPNQYAFNTDSDGRISIANVRRRVPGGEALQWYTPSSERSHRIQILPEDITTPIRPMLGESGQIFYQHLVSDATPTHECGESCPICEELRERTAEAVDRNRRTINDSLLRTLFNTPQPECPPYYDLVADCLTEGIYSKSQLIGRVRRSFRNVTESEVSQFIDEIVSSEYNIFDKKVHQLRDESLIFEGVCPEHGKFGTDIDTLDYCSTCEVYMECDAAPRDESQR
jgi:hypothetical protein